MKALYLTNRKGKYMKIARAIVSLTDKTGLEELALGLDALDVEIVSTGGTATAIEKVGVPVISVGDYTGMPEILGGRVKTLQYQILAGILANRSDALHEVDMRTHGIGNIDLVVVNLYPFAATIAEPGCTLAQATEKIDIGGVTLVRAAAKNHNDVAVVVDPADYRIILEQMRVSGGHISAELSFELAKKVFALTAGYDGAIADYYGSVNADGTRRKFGDTMHIALRKTQDLRYGENPHQDGALYGNFFDIAEQLHGKELSFNNIGDINSALGLAVEFMNEPHDMVAILKHYTPCGVGVGHTQTEAWSRAFRADPDSPFGGIVITNHVWDIELARVVDEIFTEVLIAPDFSPEALELLKRKKNRRLIRCKPELLLNQTLEFRGVYGGFLVQDIDRAMEDSTRGEVVTKRQPTKEEYAAMGFGLKVVKHTKSNAVVLCEGFATTAIGGGGTSRVDPVRFAAVPRAKRLGIDLSGSILASEAFFPKADSIEEIAEAGVRAIIQPGGSIADKEVIAAADKFGMAMVFTGVRHFKH